MRASSLALLLGIYGAGVLRVWRNAGYGRGIRLREALTFGAGWLALAIALSPQIDAWSEEWMAAHMAQHMLLMVIAAPLVAISAPLVAFLWAMPACVRVRVLAAVNRRPLTVAWHTVTSPPFVFFLYGVALWVWHMPALYDYALEHEPIHVLQHLCFFGTATMFWWGIVHGGHGRLAYGAAVVYLFATAVHGAVLGALLTMSPRVWYVPYIAHHPAGLTALEDQQLAGLLMWVPGGAVHALAALAIIGALLKATDAQVRHGA